jgi:peptidoglycan/LPS O-acetylase OafA/YrhL
MELIAAVCIAGPLGYFVSPRRRALIAYLGLWVVVFPIQSAIVLSDDFDPLYFVVNALILALGIGLNRAGSVLRERRRVKQADLSAEVAA